MRVLKNLDLEWNPNYEWRLPETASDFFFMNADDNNGGRGGEEDDESNSIYSQHPRSPSKNNLKTASGLKIQSGGGGGGGGGGSGGPNSGMIFIPLTPGTTEIYMTFSSDLNPPSSLFLPDNYAPPVTSSAPSTASSTTTASSSTSTSTAISKTSSASSSTKSSPAPSVIGFK
jgi:hypothetical protein